MSPTLSVIIPTFNRAQLLQRLLEELTAQAQPPDEIIVVDDHSTDVTKDMVQAAAHRDSRIRYILNDGGQHQRDAKKNGLAVVTSDYIGFLDDDVIIENRDFFAQVRKYCAPRQVIQAKVILENMGKRNSMTQKLIDYLSVRPYPVLELPGINFNTGSRRRRIYPLIEFGNFWPASLAPYFIDQNLIKDGYGESYSSALQLYRAGVPIIFEPRLVIRHPGSTVGGSQQFQKQPLWHGATEFHAGYFYNMTYLHARFFPMWVWLWLPYLLLKAGVGWLASSDKKEVTQYTFGAIRSSLRMHLHH